MPDGKGFGELGGKDEGIKKYKLVVTGIIKYNNGNTINDIMITMYVWH